MITDTLDHVTTSALLAALRRAHVGDDWRRVADATAGAKDAVVGRSHPRPDRAGVTVAAEP